jgi:hypothetical protein
MIVERAHYAPASGGSDIGEKAIVARFLFFGDT